jgi:hypothetical protein
MIDVNFDVAKVYVVFHSSGKPVELLACPDKEIKISSILDKIKNRSEGKEVWILKASGEEGDTNE